MTDIPLRDQIAAFIFDRLGYDPGEETCRAIADALLAEGASALNVLRQRLQERLSMAREVLDEEGYQGVAALVPLEEVLIWIDELEAAGFIRP